LYLLISETLLSLLQDFHVNNAYIKGGNTQKVVQKLRNLSFFLSNQIESLRKGLKEYLDALNTDLQQNSVDPKSIKIQLLLKGVEGITRPLIPQPESSML